MVRIVTSLGKPIVCRWRPCSKHKRRLPRRKSNQVMRRSRDTNRRCDERHSETSERKRAQQDEGENLQWPMKRRFFSCCLRKETWQTRSLTRVAISCLRSTRSKSCTRCLSGSMRRRTEERRPRFKIQGAYRWIINTLQMPSFCKIQEQMKPRWCRSPYTMWYRKPLLTRS